MVWLASLLGLFFGVEHAAPDLAEKEGISKMQKRNKGGPLKKIDTNIPHKREKCTTSDYIRMNNNVAAVIMNDGNCSVVTDPAVMNVNQWLDIFQYHLRRGSKFVPITLTIHDPHNEVSPLRTFVYTLRTMLLSNKPVALVIMLDNRTSMSEYTWRETVRNQYLPELAFYMTYWNFKTLWALGPHEKPGIMYKTYCDASAAAKEDFDQQRFAFDNLVSMCCKHSQT